MKPHAGGKGGKSHRLIHVRKLHTQVTRSVITDAPGKEAISIYFQNIEVCFHLLSVQEY